MTVIGIDISKWNGDWDAQKAKAAGAHFVFMKASQACFTDPRFVENWKKAKDAGLLRSAYHYLDYTKPALEQAKYFHDLLKNDMGELAPVVDFEHSRTDNNVNIPKNYLRQFTDYFLAQGITLIIYTAPAFWKNYGDSSTYWYQFPLWVAHYTLAAAPIVPPPWLSWKFWQFTNKGPGQLFGCEALDLDVNRFNGTLDELSLLAGRDKKLGVNERIVSIETRLANIEKLLEAPRISLVDKSSLPEADAQATLQRAALVIQDQASVRVGPFSALPVTGKVSRNELVEIVERQDQWVKIKSPVGWVESSAVKLVPEESVREKEQGEYMICRARALNIRSGPGSQFPVVGWLVNGQRIKILERSDGWIHVDSPKGWSMETYLVAD